MTHFFSSIKDCVNISLIRLLVEGRGYKNDNPANYCFVDSLTRSTLTAGI